MGPPCWVSASIEGGSVTHLMFIFSSHARPSTTSKCCSSDSMAVWIPVRDPMVMGTWPRIWRPEYPPNPGDCCEVSQAFSMSPLTLLEIRRWRIANEREM
jgi:hypothetical protein